VSELGVTKALSSGVNTRAMFSAELNGPLYSGFPVAMENAYIVL